MSARARERGREQLGTLGSGNHFVEIDVVEEIYDAPAAEEFGLHPGRHRAADPLRVARLRASGLRRLPQGDGPRRAPLRHRAARSPARLRAGRVRRRPQLPAGDGVRRELRLGEPADDDGAGRAGAARGARDHAARPGDAAPV